MSVYTENGYKNRKDYLESLAEENGVSTDTVFALAGMLGITEDFDGLVNAVEDYVYNGVFL